MMLKFLLVLFALLALGLASSQQDPKGFLVPFVSADGSDRVAAVSFQAADMSTFYINGAAVTFGFSDMEFMATVMEDDAFEKATVTARVFAGVRMVQLLDGSLTEGILVQARIRQIQGVAVDNNEPLRQVFLLNADGFVTSQEVAKVFGVMIQPKSLPESDDSQKPEESDDEPLSWEEIWGAIRVTHYHFLVWFHGLPVYQRVFFCLAIALFCLSVIAAFAYCVYRCCRSKNALAEGKDVEEGEFKEDSSCYSMESAITDEKQLVKDAATEMTV